jgi:predicted PhzF superfamily epimerase YddE/YHI9
VATFRYVVCDVFTDTPLAGNQLAVFTASPAALTRDFLARRQRSSSLAV